MSKLVRSGNTITLINSGTNLEISMSPEKTTQAAPGSVTISAYPNGGYGDVAYTWDAKFYDGTPASHLITGSSNSIIFTTTLPEQAVKVFVTASDAAAGVAYGTSTIVVGSPTSITPPASTNLSTAAGVTSASISFGTASGGFGTISYSMALAGTGTLTTLTDRTATLSNITDGDVSRVRLTCTDQFNQTATSDYVVGVGVPAIFDEGAEWSTVQEVDCTTIGTGSVTVAADGTFYSFVLGGFTFGAVAAIAGGRGTMSTNSSGLQMNLTSGTGTSITSTIAFSISNFAPMEHILVDMVVEIPSMATGRQLAVSIGDSNHYRAGDSFGVQFNPGSTNVGAIVTRRWQGAALAASVNLVASTTFGVKTWAIQILLASQMFGIVSVKESTNYLDGPKLGTTNLMRGTYSASCGGLGQSASASGTLTPPLGNLKIQLSCVNGAFTPLLKKVRARRLTRPPST